MADSAPYDLDRMLSTRGISVTASGFIPENVTQWNLAKARLLASVSDATVAFIGDSTTVGHGAGDNPVANFNNAKFRSTPAKVAVGLTRLAIPATAEAVFGTNSLDTVSQISTLPLYNPELVISSSGTTDWRTTQLFTLSGHVMMNISGTGAYSLSPAAAFDSFDIYWVDNPGNAIFTADIGGAVLQTMTPQASGASIVRKTTINTGLGAIIGSINIKRASGGTLYLIGIIPRNSSARRAQLLNLGWEGAQTGDWASDAGSATYTSGLSATASYNPLNALKVVAPDLTVVKLGANDISHSTPVATSQANIQSIITAAKVSGSCVLVIPTPQNPATRDPAGLTAAYNQMIRDLAISNGCGVIDLYSRYISWASANGLGYFADDVHSLPIGYANEADVIARALAAS